MASVAKRVEEIVTPIANELGLTIWDVEYKKEGGTYVLRIYIDRENISIDDCENFSRAIDSILDEEDPVPDSYVLEVSSAGMDRALTRQIHFDEYVGSDVDIVLYKAVDGEKSFTAKLISRDSEKIIVEKDNKEIILSNRDVASVKLTVIF